MLEKKHTNQKQILSYLMAMLLVLNIFLPSGAHAEGTSYDDANTRLRIGNIQSILKVKEGGSDLLAEVPNGGQIIADQSVNFELRFTLYHKQEPALTTSDSLNFKVMDDFKLLNEVNIPIHVKQDPGDINGGIQIGTLNLKNTPDEKNIVGTISFIQDNEPSTKAFNEAADIEIVMGASMKYSGIAWQVEQAGEDKDLWGKAFRLMPSTPEVNYKLKKTGQLLENDLSKPKIEWTVLVSAMSAGNPFSLRGHYLEDVLTTVGKYVPGSFKVDGTPVEPEITNTGDPILAYRFTDDSTKERIITFETEIRPEDLFTSPNGDLNLSNTIVNNSIDLYRENDPQSKANASAKVEFKSQWVHKGGSIYSGPNKENTESERKVTWEIIINNINVTTDEKAKKILGTPKGMTLNNVVITDPLQKGQLYHDNKDEPLTNTTPTSEQSFEEAYLQESDGKGGWKENKVRTWTKNQAPSGGVYSIGTITGPVKLTIKASIPGSQLTETTNDISKVRYFNKAKVQWDGSGELSPRSVYADFRFNSIKESFSKFHYPNGNIEWEIIVEERTNPIQNLQFFNMVTFGDVPITNIASLTAKNGQNIPDGFVKTYSAEGAGKLQGLGQRFLPNTLMRTTPGKPGTPPTPEIINLYDGDKMVGQLLVVKGIEGTQRETFKIQTEIVSKKIQNNQFITANSTDEDADKITNSSTLYTGAVKLDSDTAKSERRIRVLYKDLMKRESFGDLPANVNNSAMYTEKPYIAFDYTKKETVYRLSINPFAHDWTTREYFDAATGTMKTHGNVSLIDTLPPGWEFKSFDNGLPFMIFKSGAIPDTDGDSRVTLTNDQGATLSTATAISDPLSNLEAMGLTYQLGTVSKTAGIQNTITFNFSKLDRPAVILVKAGPTAEEKQNLFTKNGESKVMNHLAFETAAGIRITAAREDIIKSNAIEKKLKMRNVKTPEIDQNGAVTWVLDYHSYDLPRGNRDPIRIVDTIPAGLEMPVDVEGNLLYDEAVKIYEIPFTNGDYPSISTDLSAQATQDLKNNLSYKLDTNELTFMVPMPEDKNEAVKSYRIEYKTYIKQAPENPERGFRNKAEIFVGNTKQVRAEAFDNLKLQNAFVYAILGQNASVRIIKQDASNPNNKLAGARFALYPIIKNAISENALYAGVTDSSGVLDFHALRIGNYKLKETIPPTGFKIMPEDIEINVSKGTGGKKIVTIIEKSTKAPSPITIDNNNITISNERMSDYVGSLKVTKILTDVPVDQNKEFEFKMTITENGVSDLPESYDYVIYNNNSAGATKSIRSGENFKLKHGEYALIKGIPHGVSITIEENAAVYNTKIQTKDANNTVKTIASKSANLDSKVKADLEMIFSNTKLKPTPPGGGGSTQPPAPNANKGNLEISKTISGMTPDRNKSFAFQLNFEDSGKYILSKENPSTSIEVKNGDIFELKHGEKATLHNLPENLKVTVTELAATMAGYTVNKPSITSTIIKNNTVKAQFVNTKTADAAVGNLEIKKQVVGTANKNQAFEFTATFADGNSYKAVKTDIQGISTIIDLVNNGIFTLKHGEKLTIQNLPKDLNVTITEKSYANYEVTPSKEQTREILTGTTLYVTFTNTAKEINNDGGGSTPPSTTRPDKPSSSDQPKKEDPPKLPETPKTPEDPKTSTDTDRPSRSTTSSGPDDENISDDGSPRSGLNKHGNKINSPSKIAGAPKTGSVLWNHTIRNFLTYGTILLLLAMLGEEYRRKR
ncbi:MAG: DUF5979 domain-containing protein [Peptostreptococcaceae bacterium]|nr:DUF5979 domain-containing protein [Peptostreptococcaceae bacterium]